MSHKPTVTDFEVRPATYPEGHWMNRFWGPIVRGTIAIAVRVPFYRYILRAGPDAQRLLATGRPVVFACLHQDMLDCFNGLPRVMRDRRFATMASYSRDGNLSTMCLQALGYEVVRGSSSHGGGEALVMLKGLFGAGSSITYRRGFGSPAAMHRPSTRLWYRWYSGPSAGFAPVTARAILSELKYDTNAITSAKTNATATPATPKPSSRSNASPARTISSTNAPRMTAVRHLLLRISR